MKISHNVFGNNLVFETSNSLFSFKSADKGTLFMLQNCSINQDEIVLDLGCGYGLVGIACAKVADSVNVTMCDIDPVAVEYARKNLQLNQITNANVIQSNAYENIEQKNFTLILSNPPYHADFSVPKEFIEKGYRKLVPNGRMLMVTKRLEWYKRKFIAVFGGVKIFRCDDYFVFMGIKKSKNKENMLI